MSSKTSKLLSQAKARKEAIARLSEQVSARIEKLKVTKEQSKSLIEKARELHPVTVPEPSQ